MILWYWCCILSFILGRRLCWLCIRCFWSILSCCVLFFFGWRRSWRILILGFSLLLLMLFVSWLDGILRIICFWFYFFLSWWCFLLIIGFLLRLLSCLVFWFFWSCGWVRSLLSFLLILFIVCLLCFFFMNVWILWL